MSGEDEIALVVVVLIVIASDCIRMDGGLYTTMICSSSWMIKGFKSDNDPDHGGNVEGIKCDRLLTWVSTRPEVDPTVENDVVLEMVGTSEIVAMDTTVAGMDTRVFCWLRRNKPLLNKLRDVFVGLTVAWRKKHCNMIQTK